MYYKIGTLAELEKVKEKIPYDIYSKIYNIVSMLDSLYGEDRNVDESDGGYVVYADSQDEIQEAIKVLHFDKKVPELIEDMQGYTNTLYLENNEYGVNFVAPAK